MPNNEQRQHTGAARPPDETDKRNITDLESPFVREPCDDHDLRQSSPGSLDIN